MSSNEEQDKLQKDSPQPLEPQVQPRRPWHLRLKVKHIILGALLIGLLAWGAEPALWTGIKLYNGAVGADLRVDLSRLSTGSIEAENLRLQAMLKSLNTGVFNLIHIMDGGSMNFGSRISWGDGVKIDETFRNYAAKMGSEVDLMQKEPEYTVNVMYALWSCGHVERLSEMQVAFEGALGADLTKAKVSPDEAESFVPRYILLKAIMLIASADYDKAEGALYDLEKYNQLAANTLRSTINKLFGVRLEGKLEPLLSKMNQSADIEYKRDPIIDEMYNLIIIAKQLEDEKINSAIVQKNSKDIRVIAEQDGKPIENLLVYAKTFSGMSTNESIGAPRGITNGDGVVVIKGVPADDYGIGFAHISQALVGKQSLIKKIDDTHYKIILQTSPKISRLEQVPGGIHYVIDDPWPNKNRFYTFQVGVQSIADRTMSTSEIKTGADYFLDWSTEPGALEGIIPKEVLKYNTSIPFGMSTSSAETEFDFLRLVQPFYYSGTYNVTLQTHEAAIGGQPSRFWSKMSWTNQQKEAILEYRGINHLCEGDRLLGAGKIEKAMKWFDANPDFRGYRVLSALYGRGYKLPDDYKESYSPWALEGRDLLKSLEYRQFIYEMAKDELEVLGKTSQDDQGFKRTSDSVLSYSLLDMYYTLKEYERSYNDGLDAKREDVNPPKGGETLEMAEIYEAQEKILAQAIVYDSSPLYMEEYGRLLIRRGRVQDGVEWLKTHNSKEQPSIYNNRKLFLWADDLDTLKAYMPDDLFSAAKDFYGTLSPEILTALRSGQYDQAKGQIASLVEGPQKMYLQAMLNFALDAKLGMEDYLINGKSELNEHKVYKMDTQEDQLYLAKSILRWARS